MAFRYENKIGISRPYGSSSAVDREKVSSVLVNAKTTNGRPRIRSAADDTNQSARDLNRNPIFSNGVRRVKFLVLFFFFFCARGFFYSRVPVIRTDRLIVSATRTLTRYNLYTRVPCLRRVHKIIIRIIIIIVPYPPCGL